MISHVDLVNFETKMNIAFELLKLYTYSLCRKSMFLVIKGYAEKLHANIGKIKKE